MGTAVARILELWSAAAEEESWQVPLVTANEGLTAAQAAWSPGAGRNSIWRIVHHLTIWKEYRIQFMALHDAYHGGQICYIRALQNIPARGSWDDAA